MKFSSFHTIVLVLATIPGDINQVNALPVPNQTPAFDAVRKAPLPDTNPISSASGSVARSFPALTLTPRDGLSLHETLPVAEARKRSFCGSCLIKRASSGISTSALQLRELVERKRPACGSCVKLCRLLSPLLPPSLSSSNQFKTKRKEQGDCLTCENFKERGEIKRDASSNSAERFDKDMATGTINPLSNSKTWGRLKSRRTEDGRGGRKGKRGDSHAPRFTNRETEKRGDSHAPRFISRGETEKREDSHAPRFTSRETEERGDSHAPRFTSRGEIEKRGDSHAPRFTSREEIEKRGDSHAPRFTSRGGLEKR